MSRRAIVFIAMSIAVSVSVAPAFGERRDIDLHDYDDDLMRDLDKTIKYFEPDITARNAQGALDDAAILQDGFKYTADYFAKKDNAEDAVQISKDGLKFVASAIKSVSESDFDAAAEAARGAARTCRACHDTYKPLKKQ